MRGDVKQGQHCLAVTPKVNCFVSEGGKGGKTAKYADKNERPGLSREDAASFGEIRKNADCETADEVNCEGAERKGDAPGPLLDIAGHCIAQRRAYEASDTCQK